MPNPPQPETFTPCTICSGERVLAVAPSPEVVLRRADTELFHTHSTGLRALVCTNCGYVEFFAINPANLIIRRPDKPLNQR